MNPIDDTHADTLAILWRLRYGDGYVSMKDILRDAEAAAMFLKLRACGRLETDHWFSPRYKLIHKEPNADR